MGDRQRERKRERETERERERERESRKQLNKVVKSRPRMSYSGGGRLGVTS